MWLVLGTTVTYEADKMFQLKASDDGFPQLTGKKFLIDVSFKGFAFIGFS